MRPHLVLVLALGCAVVTGTLAAATTEPSGLVAASIGDQVVIVQPANGHLALFSTGPVGWLYPAPGGKLFAPDLVNGTTTVIDLRGVQLAERLDGVTMPVFGPFRDRYLLATSDKLMVVGYPERVPLVEVAVTLQHAWQMESMPDGSMVLILDRNPDGSGVPKLVAVDLIRRRQVYASPLPVGVTRMEWVPELHAVVLVDEATKELRFVNAETRLQVFSVAIPGVPKDVVVCGDGRQLAVTVDHEDGGHVRLLELRSGDHGLRVKSEDAVTLPARPAQIAADPSGRWLAVAVPGVGIELVDAKKASIVREVTVGGEPRDVVWCDLTREGPLMPAWSEDLDGTPALTIPKQP